jgi:hypothetical protein
MRRGRKLAMRGAMEAVADAKKALAAVDLACEQPSLTLTKEMIGVAKAEFAERLAMLPGVTVVSLGGKP